MIHHISFNAMGSLCEVVLVAESLEDAQLHAQTAIDEVLRIEAKYSRYRADSVVSLINANAGGEPVACDDETWKLLEFADQLYQQSDGLFDITSGVLRRAWNFSEPNIPSAETLNRCTDLIGWSRVERSSQRVRLPSKGMQLDFGGFGKEYAADRAAFVLQQNGVAHGYINLAGDMRFLGPKPTGDSWMIGIQDPRRLDQIVATLPMRQGGLTTSGDYERYFEYEGRRYCHVINPFTGMPVSFWRSVSVFAPLAIVGGCCCTIAMLKEEQGQEYLDALGFDYLAIDHFGQVHTPVRKSPSTLEGCDA
jgi:thiamine biosynthesis lipoprotein